MKEEEEERVGRERKLGLNKDLERESEQWWKERGKKRGGF